MGLQDILKSIQKNVEGTHASIMTESDIASASKWVKTPSLDLNRILSGSLYKGIPSKNLVGIVGPEGTMKSSFMVLCMAQGLQEGFMPFIIDTEGGVTDEFCKRWGLDPSKIGYIYQPWVDKVKSVLAQLKESKQKNMIIGIDSAGGLDHYKSFTDALKDDVKADQGQLQKRIRSLLKLLLNICIEQDSIGIVTGHLYGSPSLIPQPDQIGGGKAMRLFPSILINLKKTSIKEGTDKSSPIIGAEIKATTIKNRVYPPFQQATVSIDYKEGIEPCAGLIDLMIKAGLIEQSGSWYSYKTERLAQGKDNAVKALVDHKELLGELDKWLESTGYSSVNENVRAAEELLVETMAGEERNASNRVSKAIGRRSIKERSG